MYLGKAQQITISGINKQFTIDAAKKYMAENEGWELWSNVYEHKKWLRWFKWETYYKIDLYKPTDYKIVRIENEK